MSYTRPDAFIMFLYGRLKSLFEPASMFVIFYVEFRNQYLP